MRLSLDDANIPIWTTAEAHTPSGAAVDLSGSTVQWAVTPAGVKPGSADWKTGAWENGFPTFSFTPAAFPLTAGYWDVRLKITNGSQVKSGLVGQITLS